MCLSAFLCQVSCQWSYTTREQSTDHAVILIWNSHALSRALCIMHFHCTLASRTINLCHTMTYEPNMYVFVLRLSLNIFYHTYKCQPLTHICPKKRLLFTIDPDLRNIKLFTETTSNVQQHILWKPFYKCLQHQDPILVLFQSDVLVV